mgnify:FL=1|tara:strand:- start:358 stop:660 length:303 start_codon:yes stop_codon:yes gene_type:complete
MEQEIKVLVLQSGEIIISQVEEVAALDMGDPNCKLISPYLLKVNSESLVPNLDPWLAQITDDSEIMICSDKIITIVEPHKSVVDEYLRRATIREEITTDD